MLDCRIPMSRFETFQQSSKTKARTKRCWCVLVKSSKFYLRKKSLSFYEKSLTEENGEQHSTYLFVTKATYGDWGFYWLGHLFMFYSKAQSIDISSTKTLSFIWWEVSFSLAESRGSQGNELVFSSLDHLAELVEADLVVARRITGSEDAIGLNLIHVLHHLKVDREHFTVTQKTSLSNTVSQLLKCNLFHVSCIGLMNNYRSFNKTRYSIVERLGTIMTHNREQVLL